MSSIGVFNLILGERPLFHSSETETERTFDPSESLLPKPHAELVASKKIVCYKIEDEVARFLRDSVKAGARTLETGAGLSTLVFALQGADHTAITPNQTEVDAIQEYARSKHIDLGRVRFVAESSDRFLPQAEIGKLSVVLLDGKHAFPWPIIDWFYTADRLERGGLMIVDDAPLRSVRMLVDFMSVDPHWSFVRSFDAKTFVFRKERDDVHDVAWHMQPFNIPQRPVQTSW